MNACLGICYSTGCICDDTTDVGLGVGDCCAGGVKSVCLEVGLGREDGRGGRVEVAAPKGLGATY